MKRKNLLKKLCALILVAVMIFAELPQSLLINAAEAGTTEETADSASVTASDDEDLSETEDTATDTDAESGKSATDTEEGEYAISYLSLSDENGGTVSLGASKSVQAEHLWWFDNYYVNESDYYDVTKTDDFTLKYQFEFHTSEDLEAQAVTIKIEAALTTDRNGDPVYPSSIGVPYGTPGSYTSITTSPFNYYYMYVDSNGDEHIVENETDVYTLTDAVEVYLIFWNYEDITSGTNAVVQVMYTVDDIMQVKDGSGWTFTPEVSVDDSKHTTVQKVTGNALTGVVNTGVVLQSVTKTAYSSSDKVYTPGLYTETQVAAYSSEEALEAFLQSTGGEFSDYKYVVWKITIRGTATQQWSLTADDVSEVLNSYGVSGTVVGYSWCYESGSDYKASYYGWDSSDASITDCTQRDIRVKFYVVTAYDADYVAENDTIENTVTATLTPSDGLDVAQSMSDDATFTWVDYEWEYKGNVLGINKEYDQGDSGWLYEAYLKILKNNLETETDTGSFSYYTTTKCFGGYYTYNNTGVYKEGTSYEVTTVDDVLYAYPNGSESDGVMLTGDDYYFSRVSITQTDYGYDIYEDTYADPVTSDTVDQSIYIYAKYANSDDPDEWTLVAAVPWNETGVLRYTFTAAQIAMEPYRVMVVHDTMNYYTTCQIDVQVTLKGDSAALKSIITDDVSYLLVEDLSGVSGEYLEKDSNGITTFSEYFHSQSTAGDNYSEEGLEDFTNDLYGMLLQRDNGWVELTDLGESAASYKYATTENDVDNGRVLVTYYLTAYEGYEVADSATVESLKEQGVDSPVRTEVVFYDLLPYGMNYNASAGVTAGRITWIGSSSTWKTNTRAWDSSDVTVTVGEDDVITNWNGTGRTMVIFHVTYTGDDPTVYSDGMWLSGYGISFQAYYSWDEISIVNSEYNISAYMPADATAEIYGSAGEVYAEGTVPSTVNPENDYAAFDGADLNGDGTIDSTLKNVLYARNLSRTDVATASNSVITKQVRSDADVAAAFTQTTVVEYGETYTYEIVVSNNSSSTVSDIVIYDKLEFALEDGRNLVAGETVFDDSVTESWHGTLNAVITESLVSMGIDPIVYYYFGDPADLDYLSETGTGASNAVLTDANGWYTEDQLAAAGYTVSDATAVAVDISKKTDGTDFTLSIGESVSLRLNMTAPDEADVASGVLYAYNNSGFYSLTTDRTGAQTEAYVAGNSTRVETGNLGTLEVEKEFAAGSEVPAEMQSTSFTFRATKNGEALANQTYTLYNWDDTDGWVAYSVMLATDLNGYFTLKAGQKAVFGNVADVEDVMVEETTNIFWSSEETTDTETDADGSVTLTYTFTNTFRSPVYLTKAVSVADNADADWLAAQTFTFTLYYYDETAGDYVPYTGTYYLVDEALTDGSSPNILEEKETDDGTVTLHAGEILAFFPGAVGTGYKIVETLTADQEAYWICQKDTVTGKVRTYGTSSTITNLYRLRNLVITKSLEDYSAEEDDCTDEWTFRITDSSGNPVVGNTWYLIDADGNRLISDAKGNAASGTLDSNGEFTFAGAGENYRVVVEGLTAGESYTVTETNYDTDLYEADNFGTETVSMPVYVAYRETEIVNEYLLRTLKVSKLVVTEDETDTAAYTTEFTFTLYKKNTNGGWDVCGNVPYTVNGQDYTTGSDGTFTLKSGETAVFADIDALEETYRIVETENSTYPQIYPANGEAAETTLPAVGDAEVTFVNGTKGLVSIQKQVNGLDEVGQKFAELLDDDNTEARVYMDDSEAAYATTVIIQVYDATGAEVTDGDYTLFTITQAGVMSRETFGGYTVISLKPGDVIYISGLTDGYSVTATETSDWELKSLEVTSDTAAQIGADAILSEGSVMSGSAAGGQDYASITLVNNIESANTASEIYKKMTDSSVEVETGSELTFRVEVYDAATGSWSPASGISYIVLDVVYDADGDVSSVTAASVVQTTGQDGQITVRKTDGAYPGLRFVNDEVYANVTNPSDGSLRIVEVRSLTDNSWGWISGYDSDSYSGGPSLTIPDATTIVDANDTGREIEVEKVAEGTDAEDTFTFRLVHVLSASASPITSSSDVLDSEAGSGVFYSVYDSELGTFVEDGYTDENGQFTIKAGQYAVLYVPADTTWLVYEVLPIGYVLTSVVASGDDAGVLDDGNTGVVDSTTAVTEIVHSYNLTTGKTISNYLYNSSVTVTKVIFGTTKDYRRTVAGLTATHVGATAEDEVYLYNDGAGTVYILADGVIEFNEDSGNMFNYSNSKLEQITFDNISTANVENMSSMFYGCNLLTELDVSGFDTSSVTDMSRMFMNCTKLTKINVTGFDTSNVTDMSYMFCGCSGLTELDVSGFVTSNVTNMSSMFSGCSGLTELDVSNFVTSNVTNMYSMFQNCRGLTELDVSGFNTSQVSIMSWMFSGCSGLTELKVSGFDTSAVKDMSYMFQSCSGLTELDVSKFVTSEVTNMSYMFSGCSGLTELDVSMLNTGKVTNMSYMFLNCSGLTELKVSGINTSAVTNMKSMFRGCSSLTELSLSGWNTSAVTTMEEMFYGCYGLEKLDVSGLNTAAVTTMKNMFYNCYGLKELNVSGINTEAVTDMSYMFYGCYGLT
ncbi:MAG: BspA family leucine-rich repeat surface protein, partial [Lachnospiraceae bacterium]|nr:BspA family leucine-rich repeat surface protein [Lachnospiraceae bacterium]